MLSSLASSARRAAATWPRGAVALWAHDTPSRSRLLSADADAAARGTITQLRSQRHSKINRRVWAAFLADQSSDAGREVFRTIDVNRNLKVSAGELQAFLDTVDNNGVSSDSGAAELLAQLAGADGEHELDEAEFGQWLSVVAGRAGHSGDGAETEGTVNTAGSEGTVNTTKASAPENGDARSTVSALRSRRASKLQRLAWRRYLDASIRPSVFGPSRDELADDLFRTIDVNRDLSVSAQEVRSFWEGLGGNTGLKEGAVQALLEELDESGVEKTDLTKEDFRYWLEFLAKWTV